MEHKLVITHISNVSMLGSREKLMDYPHHAIEQKNDYKPLLFANEQGSKRNGIVLHVQMKDTEGNNIPQNERVPLSFAVYYANDFSQPVKGPLSIMRDCDLALKSDGSARVHVRFVELSSSKRHKRRDFVICVCTPSKPHIQPACCYPIRVVSKISKYSEDSTSSKKRPSSVSDAMSRKKTVAIKELEDKIRSIQESIDLMYIKMSNTTAEISHVVYSNSLLESEICSVQSVFTNIMQAHEEQSNPQAYNHQCVPVEDSTHDH